MALRTSTVVGYPTTRITLLASRLSTSLTGALDRLQRTVHPPVDGMRVGDIIQAAFKVVDAYRRTLDGPSTDLDKILEDLHALATESTPIVCGPDWLPELRLPGGRRLGRHPAWNVLLAAYDNALNTDAVVSVGAELASSLLQHKPFRQSFAAHLCLTLEGNPTIAPDGSLVWKKKAASALRTANQLFDPAIKQHIGNEQSHSESFCAAVAKGFRSRIELARDRDHQAVLDYRCQSDAQLRASARDLRRRVEAGDDGTMQIMVAGLSGIHVSLVLDVPLMVPTLGEWVMAVDLVEGCRKMSIELFAKGRAKPLPGGAAGLEEAGDIVVVPLPAFLAAQLAAKRQACAVEPGTLGQLLPKADMGPRGLTQTARDEEFSAVPPSAARFVNSLGKFAIHQGIDRYHAALLCGDPRLVPTGKFFYARANRKDIWEAARVLYDALGWGAPVPLVQGLDVGSQVTPKRETLMHWMDWMMNQEAALRPKRGCSTQELIQHHNQVALAAASISSFLLCLRERAVVHVSASDCIGASAWIALNDKDVGSIRGKRPTMFIPSLAAQITVWLDHCRELDRRLEQRGVRAGSAIRQRLQLTLVGASEPLFFMAGGRRRPRPIGTIDLVNWWPADMRLVGNFGRHFWQSALLAGGITSSDIDLLMRHFARGSEFHSSASSKVLADSIHRVSSVMETVLKELRYRPIPGLVYRR